MDQFATRSGVFHHDEAVVLPLRADAARREARCHLELHHARIAPALVDDAMQVLDELVANAEQHGGGPTAVLLAVTASAGIAIEVDDAGEGVPCLRRDQLSAESGRGLRIVGALALWGFEWRPVGKRVWARLGCSIPMLR